MTIVIILRIEKITAGPPLKQLLHRHHLQMDSLRQNPEEKIIIFLKWTFVFLCSNFVKDPFLEHSKISLDYCDKNQGMKNTLCLVSKHWKYFVERLILIAVFIFLIISCVIMYFLVILYHCFVFVFVVHIMWVIFVFVGHTCSCICGSYLPLCFALHFYLGSHWLVYL